MTATNETSTLSRLSRAAGSLLLTAALTVVMSGAALGISYIGTRVYTPNHTEVRALWVSGDLTSAQKTSFNNEIKKNYPNATMISGSTAHYNCHSYAWYSQSTGSTIWINEPYPYWKDGSYKLQKSTGYTNSIPSGVANGAKVYYDDGATYKTYHSAIKFSSTKFRSKWGQGPLMEHSPTYTPYRNTKSLLYYKR